MTSAVSLSINPLFVRHDLLIEMARLEMEIESIQTEASANDVEEDIVPLQHRLEKIAHVLSRVPQ